MSRRSPIASGDFQRFHIMFGFLGCIFCFHLLFKSLQKRHPNFDLESFMETLSKQSDKTKKAGKSERGPTSGTL